jgi:hypothetical protein
MRDNGLVQQKLVAGCASKENELVASYKHRSSRCLHGRVIVEIEIKELLIAAEPRYRTMTL